MDIMLTFIFLLTDMGSEILILIERLVFIDLYFIIGHTFGPIYGNFDKNILDK